MERDGRSQQGSSAGEANRNDLSGEVTGPVIQARDVSGGVHHHHNYFGGADSSEVDFTPAELSEELRQAGRVWRMRFASVDFVNLPRIAMLTSGAPVMAAARRAGLDAAKPFRGQGMAAGLFVANVRPLFETWDAEAVVLDERTIGQVRRGMLVSFESSVGCANPPSFPLRAPTGEVNRDPHLYFEVAGHRLIVSFDPRWLTTVTASGTLHDAARDPQIYAGLGQVASVSNDGKIRVSALVFGQPQTAEQALFAYAISTGLSEASTLEVNDFRNELSSTEGVRPQAEGSSREQGMDRMDVALFFDEDRVVPDEIDRAVLSQVVRVVPEYRRDLGVAISSLFLPDDIGIADTPARLLAIGRKPSLWKTLTLPGLDAQLRSHLLAVAVVAGITREQAADLDEVMREKTGAYLGAVEVDRAVPLHDRLFPKEDRYHVVGAELRLRYSASDRATAEANGEDLDEPLERWLDENLFDTVVWEEDTERSEAEEREAAMIMAWLRDQGGI